MATNSDYDYILPWMNKFPKCLIDKNKEMSFNNFDWQQYSQLIKRRVDRIFYGLVQPMVGSARYSGRTGYGKEGLKAEHAKKFIKKIMGSDYLRGENVVNRMNPLDTKLQPHIKNQENRRTYLEKYLERVYGRDETLELIKKRKIASYGEVRSENAAKQIAQTPLNYMMFAKYHRGEIYSGGKNPKVWEDWYYEKLDTNIKFVNTTSDTATMVSDFMKKITTIVDYDRIFIIPCVNSNEQGAITNMTRNDKQGKYNFKSVLARRYLNRAVSKGSLFIIPAGFSVPPMKIQDYFRLGFENNAEMTQWIRAGYKIDKAPRYDRWRMRDAWGGNWNQRIPDFNAFFVEAVHEDKTRYAFTQTYSNHHHNTNKWAKKGLPELLEKLWSLFQGHSVYPSQGQEIYQQDELIDTWVEYDIWNTRKVPFYWNLIREDGICSAYVSSNLGYGNRYNWGSLTGEKMREIKESKKKILNHLRQKGISDIIIGSSGFSKLMRPAVTEAFRSTIKTTMYDNQYIEISARGAYNTLNYVVNGIPIFEDTK